MTYQQDLTECNGKSKFLKCTFVPLMLNMNKILLDFLTDSTMPAEKELIIIIITKLIYINNDNEYEQ